jgi:natural product biosynthesis luciferase-like monooxygenase protein
VGFGLFYIPTARQGYDARTVYQSIFDEVREADRQGWHHVWIAEHHAGELGGLSPSPVVLLAALAAQTKRIRVGAAVAVLPHHNCFHLAEQYAMLDVLSGGRVDLGIGRGFSAHEFQALGVSMASRQQRFEEGIEILVQAWTSDRFSYSSDNYQLTDVEMHPRALQQPHPPIWVAASVNQESFEIAGRYGFNLMLNPYSRTREELRRGVAWYKEALASAGHDAGSKRILLNYHLYVSLDEEAAGTEPRQPLLEYFESVDRAYLKGAGEPRAPLEPRDYADLYPHRVMFGTPRSIEAQIREWTNVGVTDFSFMTQFGSLSPEHSLASLRLFSREILPRFDRE